MGAFELAFSPTKGLYRKTIAAVSMFAGRVDMVGKVQIANPGGHTFSNSWHLDTWKSNPKQEWCYMGDVMASPGFGLPLEFVCSYY